MTITHHLDDATLMSLAAGSLPTALSAVATAHVAVCARCRRELKALEQIGGALLADLAPAAVTRPGPATPPTSAAARPQQRSRAAAPAGDIPRPVAHLVAGGLDAVRWRWIGPGVWHHRLPLKGEGELQLIKVSPGKSVPEHGHSGSELTLVLRGALIDATGRYLAGDVSDHDEGIEHQPFAGMEADCICLIASDKPARFRGLVARLMQPWHGL